MESPAVLKIYGDIGEPDKMMEMFGMVDDTVSSKIVSDWLDEHKDAKEIIVKINSRGGDVQEGWAIYDLLTTSGKKIKTVGEGKVYSIATIIFLAGKDREMMKNADGLIHNPYIPPYTLAGAYGSEDLIAIAESLKQEEKKILDFYVEKTGQPEDVLAEYMKEDTKLSAEDMLKLGFATKVIEPVVAFAYIKPTKFFNMTPQEEKTFMDKVGDKITSALQALGLSRLPAKDQTLKAADGTEMKLEKESGDPAVGDKCTPDGSFKMESGKTIVVSGGVITEIKEPAAGKTDLEIANEKAAALQVKLDEANAALAAKGNLDVEKAALKAKQDEAVALVTDLQNMKNQWKPKARNTGGAADVVDGINLSRVQEIQDKMKGKTEKTE
jgi:ATP-dependent protease ClpP protease subunit